MISYLLCGSGGDRDDGVHVYVLLRDDGHVHSLHDRDGEDGHVLHAHDRGRGAHDRGDHDGHDHDDDVRDGDVHPLHYLLYHTDQYF